MLRQFSLIEEMMSTHMMRMLQSKGCIRAQLGGRGKEKSESRSGGVALGFMKDVGPRVMEDQQDLDVNLYIQTARGG